jgi:hypothetical protein
MVQYEFHFHKTHSVSTQCCRLAAQPCCKKKCTWIAEPYPSNFLLPLSFYSMTLEQNMNFPFTVGLAHDTYEVNFVVSSFQCIIYNVYWGSTLVRHILHWCQTTKIPDTFYVEMYETTKLTYMWSWVKPTAIGKTILRHTVSFTPCWLAIP